VRARGKFCSSLRVIVQTEKRVIKLP